MEFVAFLAGVGLIVWGAETFAEHLAAASQRLGLTTFALAVLLAGAEPEELATAITAGVRGVPAVAFGDVIGANIAICLVALPVAALIAPLAITGTARRYALLAIPTGIIAAWFAWDGSVGRVEGLILVTLYVAYVALIWRRERARPQLGELDELEEARDPTDARLTRDVVLVFVGTGAIVLGATVLVEAVRRLTHIEEDQTRLSLTVVGFATAFELVVLAWSAARRGMADTVVAAVIGSFAYNATMTLGAAAVLTPLAITDAVAIRPALVVMVLALIVVLLFSRRGPLGRGMAAALLVGYGGFVAAVALS